MKQRISQTQEQKQIQTQRLTSQQMLAVRLLGMPLTELEQSVRAELDDNPALESINHDSQDVILDKFAEDENEVTHEEDFQALSEREARQDALDEALANIGMDDEMPQATHPSIIYDGGADYEEITYGDQISFYDKLKEQMLGVDLTLLQKEVMEYVIGSLDSDGLLRKDSDTISDELGIYYNIIVDQKQIDDVVEILQTFDPAGIAAHNLQECLLLQIKRKTDSPTKDLMLKIVSDYYDDFMNKRWEKISSHLHLDELTQKKVYDELLRLNPKPGSSLGETEGRNIQQITPDFIVDTSDDGLITFTINGGNIPELYVSPSFLDMLSSYQKNKANMSRMEKQALLYAKEKVERAQGFIDAVKQRYRTLYVTMKTIIEIQQDFFLEGDEGLLKPMILKDVAQRTNLDISTISRVSNMKYAQTKWGLFKLRFFFSDSLMTDNGEEISTRRVKTALKELIDNEDKHHPLSDDILTEKMSAQGYPIARRTIAKYRKQLGIPVARLRKQ